jgi:hypothetical protein
VSKQLTASAYHWAALDDEDRPARCAYQFRADAETVERPAGNAATFGTRVHELVENAVSRAILKCEPFGSRCSPSGGSDGDADKHANHAITWLRDIFHEEAAGCMFFSERGFVYDALNDVAEWGPRRGEPGYEVAPANSIRGTVDWAWVRAGVLHVVDIKTGKTQNAHAEQLMVQAVALSRILKIYTVRAGFLFTRLTKLIAPQWIDLDADAIDAEAGRIGRTLRALPTAKPQIGQHCNWCDVAPGKCPAGGKGPQDYDAEYTQSEVAE